jgi:hypothetical protein
VKYFTYKLIAAAAGWTDKGPRAEKQAAARFERAGLEYDRQLARLRRRVSASAWRFFRYGILDESLEDATLIEMTFGDDILGTNTRPYLWYRNRARTRARLVFLNHLGDLRRTFECIGVRRVRLDLSVYHGLERNLGVLYV